MHLFFQHIRKGYYEHQQEKVIFHNEDYIRNLNFTHIYETLLFSAKENLGYFKEQSNNVVLILKYTLNALSYHYPLYLLAYTLLTFTLLEKST